MMRDGGIVWACALAFATVCVHPAFAHGSSGHYQPIMIVPVDDSRNKACLAGVPADPDDVQKAKERIERTMAAYFALTPQSSAEDIRAVFDRDKKDVAWKFDGASTPIEQIGPKFQMPPQQRMVIATVVGGDAQTARAIWAVTPASGSGTEYYAGDFINEGWLGGWKIWHLAIFPESKKPDTPSAYCHFDPDQAF
jgi:hypothetical protein